MNVFVAGGSRGIGRAIATGLAAPGVEVVVGYTRDDEAANEAAAEISAGGGTPHLAKGDISTPEGAEAMLAQAREQIDAIDLLVHSVVKPVSGSLLRPQIAEVGRALEINGVSLLYLVNAARPMLRSGGSVVYLSSRGGQVVLPGYGAVGAAKALAESLIRYLAVELAPAGIRANTVVAGALDTGAFRAVFGEQAQTRLAQVAERNLAGRPLKPGDVVEVIRFLTSPAATMVRGQTIYVDGGIGIQS